MPVWSSMRVRCAKLALVRGMSGPLEAVSAYYMKSPSKQMRDSVARELTDAFIEWKDTPVPRLERVRARKKSGHVPVRILQRSGALVRSILADWSPAQAVAGANLVYAATHQFGDPERNIPARPFLGASGEDNRFIVDTLIRHIDPNRRA